MIAVLLASAVLAQGGSGAEELWERYPLDPTPTPTTQAAPEGQSQATERDEGQVQIVETGDGDGFGTAGLVALIAVAATGGAAALRFAQLAARKRRVAESGAVHAGANGSVPAAAAASAAWSASPSPPAASPRRARPSPPAKPSPPARSSSPPKAKSPRPAKASSPPVTPSPRATPKSSRRKPAKPSLPAPPTAKSSPPPPTPSPAPAGSPRRSSAPPPATPSPPRRERRPPPRPQRPVPEPEAALPTRRFVPSAVEGEWETCRIRLWRGYVTRCYIAQTEGAEGTETPIARSPSFKAVSTPEATAALQEMVADLRGKGWEQVHDTDGAWHGLMRRPAGARTVG